MQRLTRNARSLAARISAIVIAAVAAVAFASSAYSLDSSGSAAPSSYTFTYAMKGEYSPAELLQGAFPDTGIRPSEKISIHWEGRWKISSLREPKQKWIWHTFTSSRLEHSGIPAAQLKQFESELAKGIFTGSDPLQASSCGSQEAPESIEFILPDGVSKMSRDLMIEILSSVAFCLPDKKEHVTNTWKGYSSRTQGDVRVAYEVAPPISSELFPAPEMSISSRTEYLPLPPSPELTLKQATVDQGVSSRIIQANNARLIRADIQQVVSTTINAKPFSNFSSRTSLTSAGTKKFFAKLPLPDTSKARRISRHLLEDEAFLMIAETEMRRWGSGALEALFQKAAGDPKQVDSLSKYYVPLRSLFALTPGSMKTFRNLFLHAPLDGKVFGLLSLAAASASTESAQRQWIELATVLDKNSPRFLALLSSLVSCRTPGPKLETWLISIENSPKLREESRERVRFVLSAFAWKNRNRNPDHADYLLRTARAHSKSLFETLALIGNSGIRAQYPFIRQHLDSSDFDIQTKAIDALRFIPGDDVTRTVIEWGDKNASAEAQTAVIQTLLYRNIEPRFLEALIKKVDSTEDEKNRYGWLSVVGRMARTDTHAGDWLKNELANPARSDEFKKRAQSYLGE